MLHMTGVRVSEAVFESLTDLASRLHLLLPDHCDPHGRNVLIAQYIQYLFQHPQVALEKASTEAGHEISVSETTAPAKPKGMSSSNPG